MNSDVHPLLVLLVLALTGLAVATFFWGSGEVAAIGGPAGLKKDPNGHVFVQVQNRLVEHDAAGRYLRTHDLGKIGIETFLGSFDFFSNGDILIRRGPDPRSLRDNVRAFQRQENRQPIEPDAPGSGLFRCKLVTGYCARFGEEGIDFKAAFGIFIDRATDEVYISDTTRHVLRKYSPAGKALSEPVPGFRFPNQLALQDGQLVVADTNHHDIRILDPTSESFGTELDRHNVAPEVAIKAKQWWPSHFLRVGDRWWINNMTAAMDYGGIYLFGPDWQFDRRLDLPDGADPIALLLVNEEIWVSDWKNDTVRRFAANGEPLPDLASAGLADILARAKERRQTFAAVSYSGIILLLLVIGGLAVRGLAVSNKPD